MKGPKPAASFLAAIAVFTVAAELAARLDDLVKAGVPLLASPDHSDLTMRDALGVRGRPLGHFQKWHLNTAGFRGPEISQDPRPGVVRVVVLGASETFGYYEAEGKEFPAQLRDSLRQSGCYEVINAAVAGMSTAGTVHFWTSWVSRFRPGIVLIYATPGFYLAEEAPRIPAEPPGPRTAVPAKPPVAYKSRLFARLQDRVEFPGFIQRARVARAIRASLRNKPNGWVFTTLPQDRLELFQRHLDSLVVSIRMAGAQPVLITHATRFSTPPLPQDQPLLQAWRQFTPRATTETLLAFENSAAVVTRVLAQSRQAPLVDAAAHMSGHRRWFADFTHFSEEGAGVLAGLCASGIRNLSPPVTCAHPATSARSDH